MTEDIVTRLRDETCHAPECCWLFGDAADEIERLRADRDKWKHWAEEFFYTDPDCECPLCDQVREAIAKTVRP